ncbi:hypothetical protein KHM83_18540 [Fusibacter paucivorans]|uniref:Uncharacterized protein n=1 Tax=Fusibacter paucivorans TaxID=76009 RepID=A0ABS5PUA2_9FIRM|nr:hypothetical protein [Fusibacter paucivorans]MBS7528671.1 hypothetical protein [Fusibacter paucivorans]
MSEGKGGCGCGNHERHKAGGCCGGHGHGHHGAQAENKGNCCGEGEKKHQNGDQSAHEHGHSRGGCCGGHGKGHGGCGGNGA